jgi:small subunit ribosomal protein S16
MAVKIRLARRGRKKLALYDIVVADARAPRDGRFIEKLGIYNPNTDPATIRIDEPKALDWVLKGAQPTDTARRILSYKGIMLRKHLQIGVAKGAITQEEADKKFEAWLKDKTSKIDSKIDSLAKKADSDKRARLEAERKVNEAKAEALKAKQKVEESEVAEEAPKEEAPAEEAAAPSAEAEVKEEAPKEEAPKEAPKEEEVKEEPKAEAKKEEPKKEEVKEEAPKAEAKKEEAPAAKEEPKEEASTEEEKKEYK